MGSRRGRQHGAEPRQVNPVGNQGGATGMVGSLSLVPLATYASPTQLRRVGLLEAHRPHSHHTHNYSSCLHQANPD